MLCWVECFPDGFAWLLEQILVDSACKFWPGIRTGFWAYNQLIICESFMQFLFGSRGSTCMILIPRFRCWHNLKYQTLGCAIALLMEAEWFRLEAYWWWMFSVIPRPTVRPPLAFIERIRACSVGKSVQILVQFFEILRTVDSLVTNQPENHGSVWGRFLIFCR